MTVFKTFLKILNKNKFVIILYTVILLIFGGFNMQTSENSMSFTPSKPDLLIINEDENKGITKDMIEYLSNHSNVTFISKNEEKINDALFYRDVNYVIYIPKNYHQDFIDGKNPEIKTKSTGDYQASLAQMLLSRYIEVAQIYQKSITDESKLIHRIEETLSKETTVKITSKIDHNPISKMAYYYNFVSYSLLACLIYVICLILSIFNHDKIRKRTIVSSTNYKKNNKILLLSNSLYSFTLWIFYVILSFIFIGSSMFSIYGLFYMLNSFVFTICATAMAFLIGNSVHNKNAISGIVNVVALGSSFLCGAFVPMKWLPDTVLKIAHILPTYYYIKTNELLTSVEKFNFLNLKSIFINMGIMLVFSVIFIILSNIVARQKRKIG